MAIIQTVFAPIKRWTPSFVWMPLRSISTAFITPVLFAIHTGHFRSSLRRRAVTRHGQPIPWYTYPCIDFLASRKLADLRVLEAGAGQSTLWWARRASAVVALEKDKAWYEMLQRQVPSNVSLHHISVESVERCLSEVAAAIKDEAPFDIIIIDGLHRVPTLRLVLPYLKEGGAIVCDNAEGYGFFAELRQQGLRRVDFFGFAPGVISRHCTSIAFRRDCFLFESDAEIPHASEISY